MGGSITVILPGTRGTSRNIAKYLGGLNVDVKMIPVIDIEIDYDEVESARKIVSSGLRPEISIFTSKTAVKIVRSLIPEAWRYAEKYSLAIGLGTYSLLRRLGAYKVELPEEQSSTGLIEFLSKMPRRCSLALYCSKHVNARLEGFIKENFDIFCINKLYTITENRGNVEKLIELVKASSEKTYLIVVTCLNILKIFSKEEELLSSRNIIYSVMSGRLLEEASRLKLPVHHSFSGTNVKLYYEDLSSYVGDLLRSKDL